MPVEQLVPNERYLLSTVVKNLHVETLNEMRMDAATWSEPAPALYLGCGSDLQVSAFINEYLTKARARGWPVKLPSQINKPKTHVFVYTGGPLKDLIVLAELHLIQVEQLRRVV